jgi:SAM-dependent methyltransferase
MISSRDDAGDYFQTRFAYDPRRDRTWKVICRYLQQFVPAQSRLLDLGAGYCSFANHIVALEKHALDAWPGFVQFALPGVHTHVGNCEELGIFLSSYFDFIFASNLLEHLPLPAVKRTLLEVRRVLKPSGVFLILQPNFRFCYRRYFDDYTHLTIFTDLGLADLLSSCKFSVERVVPKFLPLSFKSMLPKWKWLVTLYLRMPYRPFASQMLILSRAVGCEESTGGGA